MKFITFIERRQQNVIERILRHCGLWEGPIRTLPNARAPPRGQRSRTWTDEADELRLILHPDFLEAERLEARAEASCELQLVLDPEFL